MPRLQSGLTVSKNLSRLLAVWAAATDKVSYVLYSGFMPNGERPDQGLITTAIGDCIDIEGEMLSYTPTGKQAYPRETGGWEPDGRQSARPGRLARALLDPVSVERWFNDTDFERFANRIKAINVEQQGEFRVLSGEALRLMYLDLNSAKGSGSLDKSCMRYDFNQPYFDLYVKNPDKINMLALVNKNNKLVGRALLWQTEEVGQVLDRIYGTDATVTAFRGWATEKGMPYRTINGIERPLRFTFPQGQRDIALSVLVPNWRHDTYPYCDTFKHLSENGVVHNTDRGEGFFYTLNSTRGGPRLRTPCKRCQSLIAPDDWVEGGMCHTCYRLTHCLSCGRTMDPEKATEGFCSVCVKRQTCTVCHKFTPKALYDGRYCYTCAMNIACYDCGRYFPGIETNPNRKDQVCPACKDLRDERERFRKKLESQMKVKMTPTKQGSFTWDRTSVSYIQDNLAALNEQRRVLTEMLMNEPNNVVPGGPVAGNLLPANWFADEEEG